MDILEKIKKTRDKDEEVVRIVEEIKKVGVKILQKEEQQIKGDLVLKEEKVYMLKDGELRMEIIQLHHNVLVVGHERRWNTIELVTKNYQWPGVMKDVGKYMEEYDMSMDEEQNRGTNREVDGKQGTREGVNSSDSRFYHKVAVNSREGCNFGSMR